MTLALAAKVVDLRLLRVLCIVSEIQRSVLIDIAISVQIRQINYRSHDLFQQV
jgi:hypothetical protein